MACCSRPASPLRSGIKHIHRALLMRSTCIPAVASSCCNKADCRRCLLLSIADQWDDLLTGASLCSMISNHTVLGGAFYVCIHVGGEVIGVCMQECVSECIYLSLWNCRTDTTSSFYLVNTNQTSREETCVYGEQQY